jgi:hypothetical protein
MTLPMMLVRRLTGLRGGGGGVVVARAVELSGSIAVLFLVAASGRQAGGAGSLNGFAQPDHACGRYFFVGQHPVRGAIQEFMEYGQTMPEGCICFVSARRRASIQRLKA